MWAAYLKEKYPDAPRLVVAFHLYPARIHGGIPGADTLSSALREAVEGRRADPPMEAVIDDPLALGGNVLLSGDEFAGLSDGSRFERSQAFHLRLPQSPGDDPSPCSGFFERLDHGGLQPGVTGGHWLAAEEAWS